MANIKELRRQKNYICETKNVQKLHTWWTKLYKLVQKKQ